MTQTPDGPRILYVTAPDMDAARAIGAALVEARLAACANILPGMVSLYRWNDALEEGREVVLIVKTTCSRAEAATAAIVAMHPYDLPCVLAFDPAGGHAPFLHWITEAVTGSDPASASAD